MLVLQPKHNSVPEQGLTAPASETAVSGTRVTGPVPVFWRVSRLLGISAAMPIRQQLEALVGRVHAACAHPPTLSHRGSPGYVLKSRSYLTPRSLPTLDTMCCSTITAEFIMSNVAKTNDCIARWSRSGRNSKKPHRHSLVLPVCPGGLPLGRALCGSGM